MVGSVIVANMLGIFAGFWIEDRQEKLRNEILQRKLDSNTLRNWDVDGDGTIDRYEYLKARLLQLDVCTQFEIQNIMEIPKGQNIKKIKKLQKIRKIMRQSGKS